MDYKDDTSKITIRKCDLHSVLALMTLGKDDTIKSAWESIELLAKNKNK